MKIDKTLKSSIYVLFAINLYNFLNYTFHVVSSNLLDRAAYGILATVMSMVYIIAVPNDSIQTIISRYVTRFCVDHEKSRITALVKKTFKRFLLWSFVLFGLFLIISPLISSMLKINVGIIILSGTLLLFVLLLPIPRGVLQGMKRFTGFSFSFVSEGLIKVLFAFLLISVGLGVYGSVIGLVCSIIFALVLSFFLIRDVIRVETKDDIKVSGIYSYSLPVIISIGAITLMYSLDIILAKIFFDPQIVGDYAVISMLSKIIFFGTMPISRAVFPYMSEKHDLKKSQRSVLLKSFGLVFLGAGVVLLIYYLFPEFMISIFNKKYMGLSELLIYPAIAMAILSLSNIFVFYNLSNNNYQFNYFVILAVLLQIVLVSLMHGSMTSFVYALVISNTALFAFLLLNHFLKR